VSYSERVNLDAGYIFASLLVSGAGFVVFSYGRSRRRFPHMCVGAVMMGYPYVVTAVPLMLAIMVGLFGLLWLLTRLGI